jgi:hypothetical protein
VATLQETLDSLTTSLVDHKQTLDDALFALQTWMDNNIQTLTPEQRDQFNAKLEAEKHAPTDSEDSEPSDYGLVSSVLRLHATRLLYRYDEKMRNSFAREEDSPYGRAKQKLQHALRLTEMAINEAKVDTAIANAHSILNDNNANRRWLQDALTRIQSVSNKDLIKLADSVPPPEKVELTIFQRIAFFVLRIKQDEISRRTLASLRQIAELENVKLIEMAKLLAESFVASGDTVSSEQAIAILSRLTAS